MEYMEGRERGWEREGGGGREGEGGWDGRGRERNVFLCLYMYM